VQWNRLAGVAMLCVLGALFYLYISAGVSLLSTWQQSRSLNANVATLSRENRQLRLQHAALSSPGMVEAQARQLGMKFPGERAYIVTGLPND
jgi:cell division protein FtsB